MTAGAFELATIGGPWGRRLAPRRAWIDALPWAEALPSGDLNTLEARVVWTRTAFSEYASAAAFAEIATALLAAGAPIDLIAAAGDFVVDEIVHTEAAARLAGALGGAVALEVDLARLVRPAAMTEPLRRAAELIVRVSCVGEALTVPMLKLSRRLAGAPLVDETIAHIVADEAAHAQLGWWFLDWADDHLDDATRAHLGRVAGAALRAFAPLVDRGGNGHVPPHPAKPGEPPPSVGGGCGTSGLGVVACDRYDPAFADAAARHVAQPLAARGIEIAAEDLAAVGAVA